MCIQRKCCYCRIEVSLTGGDFFTHYNPKIKDYSSYFTCPACKKRSLSIRVFDRKKRQDDFSIGSYEIAISETEKLLKSGELPEDIFNTLKQYFHELEAERRELIEKPR